MGPRFPSALSEGASLPLHSVGYTSSPPQCGEGPPQDVTLAQHWGPPGGVAMRRLVAVTVERYGTGLPLWSRWLGICLSAGDMGLIPKPTNIPYIRGQLSFRSHNYQAHSPRPVLMQEVTCNQRPPLYQETEAAGLTTTTGVSPGSEEPMCCNRDPAPAASTSKLKINKLIVFLTGGPGGGVGGGRHHNQGCTETWGQNS